MKNRKWVEEILMPLDPCDRVEDANKYTTPQEAWNNWDHGDDMLWLLEILNAPHEQLVLCACEIAEHVLPIFEKEYPNDKRPRNAIEAASDAASDAAWVAARVAASVASDAAKAAACDAASDAESKWQADCVRRHFPNPLIFVEKKQ